MRGTDGGVRGHGGCRWIEHLAVKGVGAFALVDGDPRRSAESQKTARSKVSHGQKGGTWLALVLGEFSQGPDAWGGAAEQ